MFVFEALSVRRRGKVLLLLHCPREGRRIDGGNQTEEEVKRRRSSVWVYGEHLHVQYVCFSVSCMYFKSDPV